MKMTSNQTVSRREVLKSSTGIATGSALITGIASGSSGDANVKFSEVSLHYELELPSTGAVIYPELANLDPKGHVVDSTNRRLQLNRAFGKEGIAAARARERIVSFNGYRGFPYKQEPQTLTHAPTSVLHTDLRTTRPLYRQEAYHR